MPSAGSDDLKVAAEAAYSASADHFDSPALGFWERFGRRTAGHPRVD